MPAVKVDGRDALVGSGGVRDSTAKRAALLVHGAGQDHTVWALQARWLAQHGWQVLAPDLPGHGRSQDNHALDSIEAMADWCARLVAGSEEECPRVSVPRLVVGHSMGACIALTLAAFRPELVTGLVLVGCAERMPVNPALLEDTLSRPERAHRFITAFGHGRESHFGGAQTPGVWNLGAAIALLERCPPPVLHRDFAACNAWHSEVLVGQVQCPTLMIAGESDRMTPAKLGRALADAISDCRFELVAGAGHMLMAEKPREVTRLLARFAEAPGFSEPPITADSDSTD